MLHNHAEGYEIPEEQKHWYLYGDTPYEDPEIFTLPPTPENLKAAQDVADAQAALLAAERAALDELENA